TTIPPHPVTDSFPNTTLFRSLLTIDYPSEYSIFLMSTLTNDTQIPDRIYGKHGTMELGSGDPELRFNGEFAPEFKQRNDGYTEVDRKSTRLKSSHGSISYAVF